MNLRLIPGLLCLVALPAAHAADAALTSDKQKLSYAIGFQIAHQLRGDGLDLDPAALGQALSDVLTGAEPKLKPEEMQAAVEKYQQQRAAQRDAIASDNLKAGQAFLEKNKKEAGVVVLPSGLQYKVIKAGTGKKPKVTDTVTVNYRGTLINGVEFDSSYSRNEPATFPVNGVIKGWQEALPLMQEGAKWQVVIPASLAYGERGGGSAIGPNETLIFEIELLAVK